MENDEIMEMRMFYEHDLRNGQIGLFKVHRIPVCRELGQTEFP